MEWRVERLDRFENLRANGVVRLVVVIVVVVVVAVV